MVSVLYKTKMQNGDHLCLVFLKYLAKMFILIIITVFKKNREFDLEF